MVLVKGLSVLRLCGRLKLREVSKRTMGDATIAAPQLPQVIQYLTGFAPLALAESWDNVGLLAEPVTPIPVKKALLTIDLTEAVMQEAVRENANLIIAYHPPIFQPLKRVTSATWKERIIATCLENKIALFSPHTSWDAVPGGLTDWLASTFEFESVEPLTASKAVLDRREFTHELNIFCPQDQVTNCQNIIKNCTAEIVSTSKLDNTEKLSVLVKKEDLGGLQNGLQKTNCYFSIHERVAVSPKGCGTGRVGKLKSPITLSEAINNMKRLIGQPQIRVALQRGKSLDSKVESVALVAGSGASVLRGVRADLYITGEMLHHDLLEANHSGASVILLNHSDSERGFLSTFAPQLAAHFHNQLEVVVANSDRDPIVIV